MKMHNDDKEWLLNATMSPESNRRGLYVLAALVMVFTAGYAAGTDRWGTLLQASTLLACLVVAGLCLREAKRLKDAAPVWRCSSRDYPCADSAPHAHRVGGDKVYL